MFLQIYINTSFKKKNLLTTSCNKSTGCNKGKLFVVTFRNHIGLKCLCTTLHGLARITSQDINDWDVMCQNYLSVVESLVQWKLSYFEYKQGDILLVINIFLCLLRATNCDEHIIWKVLSPKWTRISTC